MNGHRIAVAGATGALGQEVIRILEERRFPLAELIPFATDRSLGEEVEIFGDVIPVLTEPPVLRGLDLLIICTPAGAALELVRGALHAEVPCIDCSGAMAASPEVPLYVADLCHPKAVKGVPLVAAPASAALAWAHVLAALEGSAGLSRVVGTLVCSASSAGRRGIEVLSSETIGMLNQKFPDPSEVFETPVAFDCVPFAEDGAEGTEDQPEDFAATTERALIRDLERLVSPDLSVAVTALRIPTFAGDGSTLAVETGEAISPERARAIFEKVPGLELSGDGESGPSTRDTAGRDVVRVGRVRRDPSLEKGLLLWLTADLLRLAAMNAVKLAETRLETA